MWMYLAALHAPFVVLWAYIAYRWFRLSQRRFDAGTAWRRYSSIAAFALCTVSAACTFVFVMYLDFAGVVEFYDPVTLKLAKSGLLACAGALLLAAFGKGTPRASALITSILMAMFWVFFGEAQ